MAGGSNKIMEDDFSMFPSLYEMFRDGSYKDKLNPNIFPDNIVIENGVINMPSRQRKTVNTISTKFSWFLTFDVNGTLIPSYEGDYIPLHPKHTLMVLTANTSNCAGIEKYGIYNLSGRSYREIAYDTVSNTVVQLVRGNKIPPSVETRLEPMSIDATEPMEDTFARIKNGLLVLPGLKRNDSFREN